MKVLIASNIETQDLFQDFSATAFKVDICHLDDIARSIERFLPEMVLLRCGCRVKECLHTLSTIKSEFPSIPVFFLTRISSEHIAIEAFRLGAKDYIKEPFSFSELHETISSLTKYINKSRERRKATISPLSSVPNFSEEDLPSNLLNAISYMEKRLAKEIKLEQLAKKAAMSKNHFCRVFKKHTGVSPMLYLTNKRIERAKVLLLDENRTISDVIAEVGFQDQSNFIKNFKKIEGVTPSFYRRDNFCPRDLHIE